MEREKQNIYTWNKEQYEITRFGSSAIVPSLAFVFSSQIPRGLNTSLF